MPFYYLLTVSNGKIMQQIFHTHNKIDMNVGYDGETHQIRL